MKELLAQIVKFFFLIKENEIPGYLREIGYLKAINFFLKNKNFSCFF